MIENAANRCQSVSPPAIRCVPGRDSGGARKYRKKPEVGGKQATSDMTMTARSSFRVQDKTREQPEQRPGSTRGPQSTTNE